MRNFAILLVLDGARSSRIGRFPLTHLAEVYPAPAPRATRLFIGYVDGTHTLDALGYALQAAVLCGSAAELEPDGPELEFTAEERAEVTTCLRAAGYTVKETP